MQFRVEKITPDLNSYAGSILELKPTSEPPPNVYAGRVYLGGHVYLRTVDARFANEALPVGSTVTITIDLPDQTAESD